jgi:phosphoglycolate phosphatase-like HAD superfamily hydrolase
VGERLVLWDIDGTLVDSGGVGADMFDVALERVLGRRPPARIRMSGKTDPQIVTEYFDLLDVAQGDRSGHLASVLQHLADALAVEEEAIALKGRALPGVSEVLEELSRHEEVLQSVLTGNLAPNALVKLRAFGLDRFVDLEIGAFGSDHADRRLLVPVALRRAAELRGRVLKPSEVWVVGDTPNDAACARAGGARCLLVATGRYGLDELAAERPDVALGDLTDMAAVTTLLRS